MLLAFEGTDVVLELEGPEAEAAVEPLAEILAARGGEDYSI
jgi:phosphotransferase system HPr-like phosphotransfer protein